MIKDARFYFANLGVDVGRLVSATMKNNDENYSIALELTHRTLLYLRHENDSVLYEKGLQLIRDFEQARKDNRLPEFNDQLNELIAEYSPLV